MIFTMFRIVEKVVWTPTTAAITVFKVYAEFEVNVFKLFKAVVKVPE